MNIILFKNKHSATPLSEMKAALEQKGHQVNLCHQHCQVQVLLKDKLTHLIILEVLLRGNQGFKLARDLRLQAGHIPILFLKTQLEGAVKKTSVTNSKTSEKRLMGSLFHSPQVGFTLPLAIQHTFAELIKRVDLLSAELVLDAGNHGVGNRR